MKRLFAIILVGLLLVTTAYAAEWEEGLSPAQPKPGLRKLDLDKEMGYNYTYPSVKIPVQGFCNVLEIYLPREDIELGTGHAHLFDSTGEIVDIDFANPDQVKLRVQQESELKAKRWGCGVCIEMYLPISLKFGESYHVEMDLNCFTGSNGKVSNYDVAFDDATQKWGWEPTLIGDYGIGGLYYSAPVSLLDAEEGEAMVDVAPTGEPSNGDTEEPKYNPVAGDIIHFDLLLGGDAKSAMIFSENDSVRFDEMAFTESCSIVGAVTRDELDWGVVFLDENNEVLDVIKPAWVYSEPDVIVDEPIEDPPAEEEPAEEQPTGEEPPAEEQAEGAA